jgi:hypothetical protein
MVPAQTTGFEVVVPFSSVRETAAALEWAAGLAHELGGRITILVPQVVPYALPLNQPPVSLDWLRNKFATLARDQTLETRVVIGLCRDPEQFLEHALQPNSTLVMRRSRLARRLSALGHNVILV